MIPAAQAIILAAWPLWVALVVAALCGYAERRRERARFEAALARAGCIDPHGYWPFAPDRATCPKCIAVRARLRAKGRAR